MNANAHGGFSFEGRLNGAGCRNQQESIGRDGAQIVSVRPRPRHLLGAPTDL